MSAAQPSRRPPGDARDGRRAVQRHLAPVRADLSELRIRRREARRRSRLLRVDLGVGLFSGIVLLLATPGLAIAALMAFALIGVGTASILRERRSSRRRRRRLR
jgi:hypothetical protein